MRIKKLIYLFILLLVVFFIKTGVVLAQGCRTGYYCQGWRSTKIISGCTYVFRTGRCKEDVVDNIRVDCNDSCLTVIGAFQCLSTFPDSSGNCPSGWEQWTINCCVENEEPDCDPSCSPACGQNDGCGGTCSDAGGIPGVPTLVDPVDGGSLTVAVGEQAMVDWSEVALADSYELELYAVGTDCDDITADCVTKNNTQEKFDALVSEYSYRVRAVNTSCGTEYGEWSEWATFTINGEVFSRRNLYFRWSFGDNAGSGF